VIFFFQHSIDKMVALAVLMPIVSSLGGNAGTQSLAVAVRALAARELSPMNAARFVTREVWSGMLNGVIIGMVMALVAAAWFNDLKLGLVCIMAVVLNLTCAGLAGNLVPLGLQRFGADPAVSSSIFVTWLTDLVGFLAFLGIATALLLH
jgi:magnesium transporter